MNKDKIREAAGKIWLNATSHGAEEPYSTLSKIILAELDKAQQPGKVLTDEEIDGIALMAVPLDTTSSDVRIAGQSIEESAPEAVRVYVRGALRYARDHYGIGAPAAGLTVEEVMEAFTQECRPPEIRAAVMRPRLRARLTAAIEAKQKP